MRKLISALAVTVLLAALPLAADAGVAISVSVGFAPPALPVYVQPPMPAPGYIWTPGYWAYSPAGYYWVPGTWVMPPAVGLLWTPGYWGWANGAYFWHAGYWGPHVGFYGGVNYGYGYHGVGYQGGYWHGDHFYYNRAVNNFGGYHVSNVYSRPIANVPASHVSFNGGAGGIVAHASPAELRAVHEQHVAFTGAQREHENVARGDEAMRASVNGGRPALAATSRPGNFGPSHNMMAARGPAGPAPTPYHAPQGQYAPHAQAAEHAPQPHYTPYPAGHGPQPQSAPHQGHEGQGSAAPGGAHGGGHEPRGEPGQEHR